MDLVIRINSALMDAIKAKDDARKRTLRAVKAQFTVMNTSGYGTTELMREKALMKMVKERQDSFDIYVAQSRFDLADPEMEEIKILEEFLPEQISEEDLRVEIDKHIKERYAPGVASMRDMGNVMKAIREKLPNADGKLTSTIVKELLS